MAEFLSFDAIRESVVMSVLLERLGIKNRTCPFCKKAKSFSAYESGKGWQCFTCKKKGGCFDLIVQIEKVSLREAAKRLQTMFSGVVEPPKRRYMEEVDEWLDALVERRDGETEGDWVQRVRNEIKGKLIESFKNGKKLAPAA